MNTSIRQQRFWVTGATGGLGRALVQRLLAGGAQVMATGRNASIGAKLQTAGATFEALDLTQLQVVDWQVRLQADDVVIHCAALSSPWGKYDDFYRANVLATETIATAAAQVGVRRLVHVSTPSIYAAPHEQFNVREDSPLPPPMNFYAQTKRQAEETLQKNAAQGLPVVMIRPRAIFGPNDAVLMPRILRACQSGTMPLIAGGRALIDITYVDNVVQALCLAATHELDFSARSAKIYNITNDEPLQVRDILMQLFNELGWPLRFKSIPWALIHPAAHVLQAMGRLIGKEPMLTPYSATVLAFSQTLDITRARAELGYAPTVSIREGIAAYVCWARTHEPLIREHHHAAR